MPKTSVLINASRARIQFSLPVTVLISRCGRCAGRDAQRPGRERVGREPRVHDPQGTGQPIVLQIQVEALSCGVVNMPL
ncbi:putative glutamate synthase(NADPH) large subunit domain protein [Mycobacterium ulcerans str. Harvey]|uniref:Glutamate synthase(NADPH) large subunit domain protein n=1 Tax=Mycobacterium ulcerans str. Harvey TaxID=1299332 RepID=A0ABP3A180_MYCUL|nr:putative glutamate synthase(NADPH) large subunit domain protein [Mycobacterium ulcerans str. Harvey]